MTAHEYRDDDEGYRVWLNKNRDGYVINLQRSHNPSDAHLHDADCWTLTDQVHRDVSLTGSYVKVCGATLTEIKEWAAKNVGEPIEPCGTCRNPGGGSGNGYRKQNEPGFCPLCRCELPVTGRCHSCDDV